MRIEFVVSRLSGPDRDYVSEIEGGLYVPAGEDGEEQAGRVTARVLCLDEAREDGVSSFDVADRIDQLSHDVWAAVIDDRTDCFRDFADEALSGGNILLVQAMEILPEYRKQGFGHLILDETIRTFEGGCGIIVIEPHPLRQKDYSAEGDPEWKRRMRWEGLAKSSLDYAEAAARLRKHWSKLGFKPVPKTRKRFFYRLVGYAYPRVGLDDHGEITLCRLAR